MTSATDAGGLLTDLGDPPTVQRAATGRQCHLNAVERCEVIRRVADGEAYRRVAAEGLGVSASVLMCRTANGLMSVVAGLPATCRAVARRVRGR